MTDTLNNKSRVTDWVSQIIEAVIRRAGSELVAAERRAGVAPGYLRKALSDDRNIMLAKLLRICEETEIEPGEVFAEVFASPRVVEGLPFAEGTPTVAERTEARLRGENEQRKPTPLAADWLDWLEELRYDEPERALTLAEEAVAFLDTKDLLRNLGIWASACRPLVRLSEGYAALRQAVRLAEERGDDTSLADLLRRLSFMLGAMTADWGRALSISDRALAHYVRLGEATGQARVLVDQGVILVYLGRYHEAQQSFEASLTTSGTLDRRHHFAALHGIGDVLRLTGAPSKALIHALEARGMAQTKAESGKLSWLQAQLHDELGEIPKALEAFECAFGTLVDFSPIDAALVVCDHVRALLAVGRVEEARSRSLSMRQLLEPLKHNTFASAAIRDLLCVEDDGQQLTSSLVALIRERIEKSRRARARRQ